MALFDSGQIQRDKVDKLVEAVKADDARTARQLLLNEGDACNARTLAEAARDRELFSRVSIFFRSSGDKETVGVARVGNNSNLLGEVASVEFAACDDATHTQR